MYDDARLAAVYDVDNPDGPDHDFFRALADEVSATRIVDLGCGTGILTVTLTRDDREVTGIDPAPAMLDYARNRPGADRAHWIQGTSDKLAPDSADLVLMTGNVAMHIIGDEWHRSLSDIARGLRPGGRLAFETRNPSARAWEHWNEPTTERDTPVGRLRESTVTDPPDRAGVMIMHCRNEFQEDGAVVENDLRLQFRSFEQVRTDLSQAGLRVLHVWSDWRRTPFRGTAAEPLMVFEAVKTSTARAQSPR